MKLESQLYDVFDDIRSDLAELVPDYGDLFAPSDLFDHLAWRNPWLEARYGESWR